MGILLFAVIILLSVGGALLIAAISSGPNTFLIALVTGASVALISHLLVPKKPPSGYPYQIHPAIFFAVVCSVFASLIGTGQQELLLRSLFALLCLQASWLATSTLLALVSFAINRER